MQQTPFKEQSPFGALEGRDFFTVIRLAQFARMLGLSRSMVYLKLNGNSRYSDPRMPRKVQLSSRAVGFYLGEVIEYIEGLPKKK